MVVCMDKTSCSWACVGRQVMRAWPRRFGGKASCPRAGKSKQGWHVHVQESRCSWACRGANNGCVCNACTCVCVLASCMHMHACVCCRGARMCSAMEDNRFLHRASKAAGMAEGVAQALALMQASSASLPPPFCAPQCFCRSTTLCSPFVLHLCSSRVLCSMLAKASSSAPHLCSSPFVLHLWSPSVLCSMLAKAPLSAQSVKVHPVHHVIPVTNHPHASAGRPGYVWDCPGSWASSRTSRIVRQCGIWFYQRGADQLAWHCLGSAVQAGSARLPGQCGTAQACKAANPRHPGRQERGRQGGPSSPTPHLSCKRHPKHCAPVAQDAQPAAQHRARGGGGCGGRRKAARRKVGHEVAEGGLRA